MRISLTQLKDGDTETVTMLMKQKDDDLIIAIYEGDIKTVEMLLKTGSDVNAIDDNGWSALYLASMNGYTDIVAILLENGALPIMSEAEFQECEKQKDEDTGREWVECSISLDEINRFQAVKPLSDPPNNNKVCFKRSALQRMASYENLITLQILLLVVMLK